MDMLTKYVIGTGTRGGRDASEQKRYRSSLIEAYNATEPLPRSAGLWCPVLAGYFSRSAIRASHIFAYQHGQKLMDDIFGTDDACLNGLFSPHNGLCITAEAEERFDKGFFVIVPCIEDELSSDQVRQWHASSAKRYKIRVVEPKAAVMKEIFPPNADDRTRTWLDLDGQELQFRSHHRPRARYLYFHFCVTMLRRSWHHNEHESLLRDELGKKFWGTPGSYLRKKMLLAFVEELGYDEFLDGAVDADEGEEREDVALLVANDAVRISARKEEEEVIDVESESEEEDTDEDDRDGSEEVYRDYTYWKC